MSDFEEEPIVDAFSPAYQPVVTVDPHTDDIAGACICYPGMCPMGCEPACPACFGMSTETPLFTAAVNIDDLAVVISRDWPTEHHKGCDSRVGDECDCYMRKWAVERAALERLVSRVGTLEAERDETRGDLAEEKEWADEAREAHLWIEENWSHDEEPPPTVAKALSVVHSWGNDGYEHAVAAERRLADTTKALQRIADVDGVQHAIDIAREALAGVAVVPAPTEREETSDG